MRPVLIVLGCLAAGEYMASGIARNLFPDEVGDLLGAYRLHRRASNDAARFYPMGQHPYFGLQFNPGGSGINNYGFDDPLDFPYRKKPGEFVIAVVGASVPQLMTEYAVQHNSFQSLAERIPALRGKRIVVLNLCLPAARQPQPFFISSYFAGMADLFINVDGIFEMLRLNRRYPVEFPENYHYLYGPGRFGPLDRLMIGFFRFLDYRATQIPLWVGPLAHSSLYFLSWKFVVRASGGGIAWIVSWAKARTAAGRPFLEASDSDQQNWESILENWTRYTQLQDLVTRHEGKKTVYFVRPSQYYGDPDMAAVSGRGLHPPLSVRFAALQARAKELRRKGILIFDLSNAFAGVSDTIYENETDHLDDLGNGRLIESIINVLARNARLVFGS